MKRRFAYWWFGICLAAMFAILAWITTSMLELEARNAREQERKRADERVRLCLWRMDSFVTYFLLEANRLSPSAFAQKAGSESLSVSSPDYYVKAYFEVELPTGIPFAPPLDTGIPPSVPAAIPARLSEPRPPAAARPGVTADSQAWQSSGATRDLPEPEAGLWMLSSRTMPGWSFASDEQMATGSDTERFSLSVSPFESEWIGPNLVLSRRVDMPWHTVSQAIWMDWERLQDMLTETTRDILPGARIVPYTHVRARPGDVNRLMANIPVLLEPGPIPAEHQDTGQGILRFSLGLAWFFAVLATAGAAALLIGTLRMARRREMFAATVTHELRTPLTTFSLYTDMLLHGFADPAEQTRYLISLKQEAGKLARLVNNVLAFWKMERSPCVYPVRPMTGGDLAREIEGYVSPLLSRRGIGLVVELGEEALAAWLETNDEAVGQILVNLADNSVKYAADLSQVVRIRLDVEGAWLAIRYRDAGPGIPVHVARRVFNPFSGREHQSSASSSGLGLGLPLSRKIARQLGGRLSLEHNDSSGAAFLLRLRLTESSQDHLNTPTPIDKHGRGTL